MTRKKAAYTAENSKHLADEEPPLNDLATTTASELNQPLWAVTSGTKYYGLNLTYDEAVELLNRCPDGIIITVAAATRLPVG